MKRLTGIFVLIIALLIFVYFPFHYEEISFSEDNRDVETAYRVGRELANEWHYNAILDGLTIVLEPGKEPYVALTFKGRGLFGKFADNLTIQVELQNQKILYRNVL